MRAVARYPSVTASVTKTLEFYITVRATSIIAISKNAGIQGVFTTSFLRSFRT